MNEEKIFIGAKRTKKELSEVIKERYKNYIKNNEQKLIDIEKITYVLDNNYTEKQLKKMLDDNKQIVTKKAGKFSLCKSKILYLL